MRGPVEEALRKGKWPASLFPPILRSGVAVEEWWGKPRSMLRRVEPGEPFWMVKASRVYRRITRANWGTNFKRINVSGDEVEQANF